MRFIERAPRGVCLAVCLALGGCVDLTARDDFIDASLGDATAANKAIQTIDPWPREAFSAAPSVDGQRSAAAVEQYRAGAAGGGKSAATQ